MDTENEDLKDLLAFDSNRGLAVDNGDPTKILSAPYRHQ